MKFISNITTKKWLGVALITFLTLLYFLPIVIRVNSYMPGGDAMFNAWTISRNQHCILRQHCENYTDANIYFPNKDTMLYSEAELSPAVITLPIRLITENPIVPYNIVTIASFLMAGLSMYWLLRYLTKGNEFFSVLGGLAFEFSPIMIASTHHLQNLSIFCLPLAVLFILKYLDKPLRKYLVGLFLALLYVFYASWYQMVFVLLSLGILIACFMAFRTHKFRALLIVSAVIAGATLATLPLAKQYMRFSNDSGASYGIKEKIDNSANITDYSLPPDHTLSGKLYRHVHPEASVNPYTYTYSYAGVGFFLLILATAIYAWRRKQLRKQIPKFYIAISAIGIVGFIISLGPFLRIRGEYVFHALGENVVIPMPYAFVHAFIPQLGFMRGLGRSSILVIFALCVLLAVLATVLAKNKTYKKHRILINVIIALIVVIDLAPIKMVALDPNPHAYHTDVPAVYKYIKDHPEIDNIINLQAQEYPNVSFWFARTENVLWAGYHNRNIFNGYSGYIPLTFEADYSDFVNLDADDPEQMRRQGLRYVIVDSELYKNKPEVFANVPNILGKPMYTDTRYSMYKL